MRPERLRLERLERAQYFAPVAFCAWIALLCLTLVITAQFLRHLPDAAMVAAAGIFGLLLCTALGAAILWVQQRELQYLAVITSSDAQANFDRIERLLAESAWHIVRAERGRQLLARGAATELHAGDIIAVQFREREVLIASISDPAVGFSLAAYRRCAEHRARLRDALLAPGVVP